MGRRRGRSARRIGAAALVVAAVCFFARPAGAGTLGPDDLTLVSTVQSSARAVDHTFTTPALAAPTTARVILPTGYDPGRRYPVLFLLHGGAGQYSDWSTAGNAEALTAGLPLILVLPDSLRSAWYTDWYNNGRGGTPMLETYHIDQLLPWVDAHYPTIGTRAGRAIAGLSSGGFGTMSYASRHPDLFVAAAAFSGAVDTNTPYALSPAVIDALSAQDRGVPGSLFGLWPAEEIRWRGHNPWDLAPNLHDVDLTVRTGNGRTAQGVPNDPLEYAVHDQSVSFHERLVALGKDHVFEDYGPGGHTWNLWQRDLTNTLPHLMDVFAEHRADPATVSFRAVEPSYERWGWRVAIDRPALEWSALEGASAAGFRLSGSGTATVTTPPRYTPGGSYDVSVDGPAGPSTEVLVADGAGRLTVTVPLGAANPAQQVFTPDGESPATAVTTTGVTIAAAADPVVPDTPIVAVLPLGAALVLALAAALRPRTAGRR